MENRPDSASEISGGAAPGTAKVEAEEKSTSSAGAKKRLTASEQKVLDMLHDIDVNEMTPIAALLSLLQMKEALEGKK